MLQLRAQSVVDTHAIASAIAGLARAGDVVVLAGEMGAGKTAFAQGFGAALGVTDHMTSPTYNLVHSHRIGKLTLHHADLYRLSTQHEVADLAFAELAEGDGIVIVEWGDVVGSTLGEHLLVELTVDDDPSGDPTGSRSLVVSAVGRAWATRWDEVTRRLAAFAC
ncbi:MAG: tRNA (adenosine(37)-N6)-threonylcarbamoyltransferase complex ATPase subunit type 1 TsaE [Ilumatobacteraceae bacterium]|jgi:tRNA threonylcarbamoyladenosine biosynthesis protein TsaE